MEQAIQNTQHSCLFVLFDFNQMIKQETRTIWFKTKKENNIYIHPEEARPIKCSDPILEENKEAPTAHQDACLPAKK